MAVAEVAATRRPAPTGVLRSIAVEVPSAREVSPIAALLRWVFIAVALVAQQEREAISRRTKEGLAVAKSRGVKLGNPNWALALRRAGKGGAAALGRNADCHLRT